MTVLKPRPNHHSRRRVKDDDALTRAILRLPTDLRDVFLLHRMVGMTYDQIGLHMGMEPGAVQAALSVAMVRLMRAARVSEAQRCA